MSEIEFQKSDSSTVSQCVTQSEQEKILRESDNKTESGKF